MIKPKPLTALKIACIESGIPQRILAQRVGINESVLSNAIRGCWILSEEQQRKIASILEKPTEELFPG